MPSAKTASDDQAQPDADGHATAPAGRGSRGRLWAGLLGVGLGLIVAFLLFGQRGTGPDTSWSEVSVDLFAGGETTLADFEGTPLVVNFWASWCPPCVDELPVLQAGHERFGDDVMFIGVANKDERSLSADLADEAGLTYSLADNEAGELFRSFDLFAMPSTVFIDANGMVHDIVAGRLDEETLTTQVESLLADS